MKCSTSPEIVNIVIETKPKKRSEQGRAKETKSKILAAALHEFSASGFEGVSTRAIASRAGVNHTLISHHFGSKTELWKATADWIFGLYTTRSQERYKALKGVEVMATIKALLKDFIEFSAAYPDFHRFMMQANRGDAELMDWLTNRFLRQGAQAELTLFEQAQELGFMPKGDGMHMRYLFIGAATSIFTFAPEYSRLTDNDPFSESVIEQHTNYVLGLFSQNLH